MEASLQMFFILTQRQKILNYEMILDIWKSTVTLQVILIGASISRGIQVIMKKKREKYYMGHSTTKQREKIQ